MDTLYLSLHANTPAVSVIGSNGDSVRILRFLRQPNESDRPARCLTRLQVKDLHGRILYLYGSRPLTGTDGTRVADAVTLTALSGQPLMLHTPDGDRSLSFNDAAGRLLWSCNAQKTINTFLYEPVNKAGRLISVSEMVPDGSRRIRQKLEYAAADDAEIKARNLAGMAFRHYDNAGYTQLLSVSLSGQTGYAEQRLLAAEAAEADWSAALPPPMDAPLTNSKTFDATGAVLTQTNAAGVTTLTAYNVSGAVQETHVRYREKAGQPEKDMVTLKNISRRADGLVLSQTTGNDVTERFVYDRYTQLLLRHIIVRPSEHPSGHLLISDLHYYYDPTGNILTINDKGTDPTWHNNQQTRGLRKYRYDTLYRLTEATGRERSAASRQRGPKPCGQTDRTAGKVWSPFKEQYTYDDGDNLIKIVHGGARPWTHVITLSARSNRGISTTEDLSADPHDAYLAGGLKKTLDDGRLLRWYADGQLASVRAVTRAGNEEDDTEHYRYSNPGRRVRKVRTARTCGGTLSTITLYAGDTEWRKRTLSTTGTTQLQVVITDTAGVRIIGDELKDNVYLRYAFRSHLNSVCGETDEYGNITAREEYMPFGNSAGADEEALEITDRTRRYSGQERDITGLYYYGWRYYQPASGRWLSADPGGLIDGVNLYLFCLANPVNFFDPNGKNANDWRDIEQYIRHRYPERAFTFLDENTHEGMITDATSPFHAWGKERIMAAIKQYNINQQKNENDNKIIGVYVASSGFFNDAARMRYNPVNSLNVNQHTSLQYALYHYAGQTGNNINELLKDPLFHSLRDHPGGQVKRLENALLNNPPYPDETYRGQSVSITFFNELTVLAEGKNIIKNDAFMSSSLNLSVANRFSKDSGNIESERLGDKSVIFRVQGVHGVRIPSHLKEAEVLYPPNIYFELTPSVLSFWDKISVGDPPDAVFSLKERNINTLTRAQIYSATFLTDREKINRKKMAA